ncbi:MAG: Type 1 glutamine amidotransferase-like domain-containing protein [Woeseiaceae bacterium]|nr:Type 1 glutamine amidotransferase-like domain-containing protein [Woeseiaceae bacterium]
MIEAPLRLLLGPQNPLRNVGKAMDEARVFDGPVAVISAAWQEAENDLAELAAILGRELEDLELYRRADAILADDTELADAYRERQDRLQEQQRLYRIRLRSLAVAARRVFRAEGNEALLETERRHAIRQLRALDRHHLNRTEALHDAFESACDPLQRSAVREQRDAMREILERSSGVLITGGNLPVLVNRLRLFGLDELLRPRHIVAWSAGAMVLAKRIVLFHERMPQGRREPEIFGAGMGLVPGSVILPDTRHRLVATDRQRIALMARRFAPDACVALDNDTAATWSGDRLLHIDGARRLNRNGRMSRLRAA